MIKLIENFLVLWGVLILLNQVLFFHSCLRSYCIIAALPHTGIIAGIIMYYYIQVTKN